MIAFGSYVVLSAALVGLYRWLALRHRWLDMPNHRSSHATVTPRGAGLIFALLIIGAAAVLLHSQRALLPPLFAGLAVALIGWRDDVRGTSARARLALYSISAAGAVALIFAAQNVEVRGSLAMTAPLACGVAATLGLVWLINLYNFMDGINGIAAIEALFVLLAIGMFARGTPYAQIFSALHLLSGAAIAGFLVWNFPAGKVFMGDAGSAFLGFFLGLLMLWSTLLHGPSLVVWLILLGIFIVDSGYTLLVRIGTGQTWYAAHRLHAYQLLTARLHANHVRTVAWLMIVNAGWLLPMAWLVHTRKVSALSGLGIAYLPLIAACYRLKAGISAQGRV